MINFKDAFLKGASKFEDKDELEINYKFGNPASEEDLEELEKHLKTEIPEILFKLFSEFNGIEVTQEYWSAGQLYLSTTFIINKIPKYFQESGNYVPPKEQLASVIFFAQQNGLAALFALCVKPFDNFNTGEVLVLESDTGEFEREIGSLEEFIQSSAYCHLG